MRKILAIILSISMLLVLFINGLEIVEGATTITESQFNSRFDSFKNNVYPDGETYINDSSFGGYECFGYANEVAEYIYGSFPTSSGSAISDINSNWTIIRGGSGIDQLHIGDIVRYRANSWDHSVFVYKISGNTVYYTDANAGSTYNIVASRSTTKSELMNRIKLTLYGNSDVVGFVAHYKGWSNAPHTTHSYSGSYFEAAHPHKYYQQCSCGATKYTGATRAYGNCSTCMKISWAYVQPVKAYTINTGKTTVYSSVEGSAKTNRIYDTDFCTISEIYDCGWCKVTFPLDAGGTDTGYVKISTFMKSGGFISYAAEKITTYNRSNLSTSIGYTVTNSDLNKIYILGNTSSAVQIAYPLQSGGWKVGWVPISSLKATIKYNANGGSGTMANTSTRYQSSFTLASNKFTKAGYAFGGWNAYRSSDKKWYVSGQGWCTANQISSNNYKKAVYKNGWSGTYEQSWLNLAKTNETLTFYAYWVPNTLTVYFNANGGSVTSDTYSIKNGMLYVDAEKRNSHQLWTYNSAKSNGLMNASTYGLKKTGYTFKGWGTKTTGGTIFDQNDTGLLPSEINSNLKNGNCSTTLYAIWIPNELQVTYHANGGTISSTKYMVNNNLVSNKTSGAALKHKWEYNTAQADGLWNAETFGLTRMGYTFKGWGRTTSGGTVFNQDNNALRPLEINSNLNKGNCSTTLYAIWSPNQYTVAYDANGGTGAPGSQTKTFGTTLKLSTTIPKKTGYVFKGWATDSTATTANYQAGRNYTANAACTLYAVWEKIPEITVEILIGDVDGDLSVSANDALMVLKCVVGKIRLSETQLAAAELTDDTAITASDALQILKIVVGKA